MVRGAKAAFVAGALPGEEVRLVRRLRHRQHDDADLLEVLQARPTGSSRAARTSGSVVAAPCSTCRWRRSWRRSSAELAEACSASARSCRSPGSSRSPVRHGRTGGEPGSAKYVTERERVLVGFRERQKPYVAALSRCEILAPPVGELIEPLSALLTGLAAREAIPQIEVAVATW